MDAGGTAPISVDETFVQELAAANGLALTPKRAADLIPAVQAILDADAQLARLDLGGLSAAGLPWAAWRGSGTEADIAGRRGE